MENPWKKLRSEEKYSNPWIRVVEDKVTKPNGDPGIYGIVEFKNLAIGILPLAENGDTWLVGQFRYPLNSYSWEIPEGGGRLDVPPLDSAKRELREETGITATDWELILEMDLSNSTTNERSYSFIARDLTLGTAQPDDDEVLQLRRLPFKEVYEMVCRGELRDGLTVATVLRAATLLGSDGRGGRRG